MQFLQSALRVQLNERLRRANVERVRHIETIALQHLNISRIEIVANSKAAFGEPPLGADEEKIVELKKAFQ